MDSAEFSPAPSEAPTLFSVLTSEGIADLIRHATNRVCYVAPSIQAKPAQAMVEIAHSLGKGRLTVHLDFDEGVFRMGYGDLDAVARLRDAGIAVRHWPGVRTGLIVVDDAGYVFTPTPLYLEAEPAKGSVNAMRLLPEQVGEALSRLPEVAGAKTEAAPAPDAGEDIDPLPAMKRGLGEEHFKEVRRHLQEAPPVEFDLARQVRVFEPYLQYVELAFSGAAIQRHRLTIPPSIQRLGAGPELENRLRTTFELIERGSRVSSKPLEDALNEIRKDFTKSLGKEHGRVILKARKPQFLERIKEFRAKLEAHQKAIVEQLHSHIDKSRQQITEYFVPRVVDAPPDRLIGQMLGPVDQKAARSWVDAELKMAFPDAASLADRMVLDVRFKDVTFETLDQDDFLALVQEAFPHVDWHKAYKEFRAAGETRDAQRGAGQVPAHLDSGDKADRS